MRLDEDVSEGLVERVAALPRSTPVRLRVALWRPLDLLLFERWALRREIALYRRLEGVEVEVVRD